MEQSKIIDKLETYHAARCRVFDVGVFEPERVKSECRLERVLRDADEVEEEQLSNKVRISSILASFSWL